MLPSSGDVMRNRWWAAAGMGLAGAVLCGPACGGSSANSEGSTHGASTNGETTSTGDTATGTVDSTTSGVPAWTTVVEVGEDVGAFFSVWGPSPDLVYAVGGQQGEGGFSQGAMMRREAGTWGAAELPPDTAKLNWIHGRDTLRVVVGDVGTILVRDGDDGEWELFGCGTVLPLWGTWISAADDVWAVGGDGFMRDPVLCHFDGSAWTMVELPDITVDSKGLFKVFGVAADDVWAVGDAGLLLHWDGSAWMQVEVDTPADLISLWGTGPSELLAVGGRANGVLLRYDGAAWTSTALAEVAGLNGVWMDADGTARIGGAQGTIAVVDPGAAMPLPEDSDTLRTIHAVWQADDGRTYAVGGSIDLPPPFVGVILERAPD
jgi:hypothetical protein